MDQLNTALGALTLAIFAAAMWPDPGQPGIVAFVGTLTLFFGSIGIWIRTRSRERVKDSALELGLIGAGLGLVVYAGALLGLYA